MIEDTNKALKLTFALLKLSEADKENKKLGTVAIQNFICANSSCMALVYYKIPGYLVFYSQ